MAAATVIEYLVATYSRERLLVLIEGMRRYRTWEELVPAVVDATAEEFEIGWQSYVATRYGSCEPRCIDLIDSLRP